MLRAHLDNVKYLFCLQEFLRNWKAGLQALLPNINISFSGKWGWNSFFVTFAKKGLLTCFSTLSLRFNLETFSPTPQWHSGDSNGSSSLSSQNSHHFKSYGAPTTQVPAGKLCDAMKGLVRMLLLLLLLLLLVIVVVVVKTLFSPFLSSRTVGASSPRF